MIQGLIAVLAVGIAGLTSYALFGHYKKTWAFIFPTLMWCLMFVFAILSKDEPVALAICILIVIGYPAIIIVLGIRTRKKRKMTEKILLDRAKKEGLTVKEVIISDIPPKYLEICEYYKGKPLELEPCLKSWVKAKTITKEAYYILLEEYSK